MSGSFRVLVVCTANICRSPYIEARLRHELMRSGAAGVAVESAGTRALTGEPMAAESSELLARAGVDSDPGFRARQITVPMLERADLVLTATRDHRAQVLDVSPAALRRTLTLTEFAGLLTVAPPPLGPSQGAWAQAVRHAMTQRGLFPALVNSDHADLADPYGRGAEAFEAMDSAVDIALEQLSVLWRD